MNPVAWGSLALLGILGSLGHCAGMCAPVAALFHRRLQGESHGFSWVLATLHLGRVSTYALLGAVVGALGRVLVLPGEEARALQGGLALALAALLGYASLAALGWVPPLERAWNPLAGRWQTWTRGLLGTTALPRWAQAYLLGLLWGWLPCGLVYSALLLAAAAGHPGLAALGMLLFGLTTVPVTAGVAQTLARTSSRAAWQKLTAGFLALVALQMGLRGLAVWGLVPHFRLGGVMLW